MIGKDFRTHLLTANAMGCLTLAVLPAYLLLAHAGATTFSY